MPRLADGDTYSFIECLYLAECPLCGDIVDWEASFDADGTNYHSSCCGLSFIMCPASVAVSVTGPEEQ